MAAHYRQLGWLLWLVALTCSAENQYGPSFDCKQAKLEIEQDICSNDVLARADQFIHDCYQALLKLSPDKNKLIAEQRAWLQSRNHYRDNNRNQRFFHDMEFIADRYDETAQLYQAFQSRIAELFEQLPPSQQRQLREHYLRQMGFRETPSDPVEKWVYQRRRDYAFETLANDCEQVDWEIIRNDHHLAVVVRTNAYLCGGTSWASTFLEAYCINHNQLTRVDATPRKNEFDDGEVALDDDQILELARNLSAKTLCEATK